MCSLNYCGLNLSALSCTGNFFELSARSYFQKKLYLVHILVTSGSLPPKRDMWSFLLRLEKRALLAQVKFLAVLSSIELFDHQI